MQTEVRDELARPSDASQDALSTAAEIESLAADLAAFAEQVDDLNERGRLLRASKALLHAAGNGEVKDISRAGNWVRLGDVAGSVVARVRLDHD